MITNLAKQNKNMYLLLLVFALSYVFSDLKFLNIFLSFIVLNSWLTPDFIDKLLELTFKNYVLVFIQFALIYIVSFSLGSFLNYSLLHLPIFLQYVLNTMNIVCGVAMCLLIQIKNK